MCRCPPSFGFASPSEPVAKVAMQTSNYCAQGCSPGRENKDICHRLRSDIDKAAKNTTAASARYRIIRWIISIMDVGNLAGAMPKPLESILIPRLYCGTKTIAMESSRGSHALPASC